MILTLEALRALGDTGGAGDERLTQLLSAAEETVRRYTCCDFHVRGIGFAAQSENGCLLGSHSAISAGDSVEISGNGENSGIYTVKAVENGITELDRPLTDSLRNVVRKIVYPEAVKETAGELVLWQLGNLGSIGITGETLGRHSVSYAAGDDLRWGYPKGLLERLNGWRRIRT